MNLAYTRRVNSRAHRYIFNKFIEMSYLRKCDCPASWGAHEADMVGWSIKQRINELEHRAVGSCRL